MTCIIAYKNENGNTILAGDKLGSNGFTKQITKRPKVFKNGDFMFGQTGSFLPSQLLEFVWSHPSRNEGISDDKYLYSVVVPSIRKCFKDNEFGDKGDYGDFIMCYKGRVLEIQCNMSILEREEDIICVGSGEYHAKAAIEILKVYETDDVVILEKAFDLVSKNIASVSKEYDWITDEEV